MEIKWTNQAATPAEKNVHNVISEPTKQPNNTDYQQNINAAIGSLRDLERNISQYDADIQHLKQTVEQYRKQSLEKETLIKEILYDKKSLSDSNALLKKTLHSLQSSHDELMTQHTLLRKQLYCIEAENQIKQTELSNKIKQLSQQLNTANSYNHQVERRNMELKEKNLFLKKEAQSYHQHKHSSKAIDAFKKIISELESGCDISQSKSNNKPNNPITDWPAEVPQRLSANDADAN